MPEPPESLEMSTKPPSWFLVASHKPLICRAGSELSSEIVGEVMPDTSVLVHEWCEVADGVRRARVSREGEDPTPLGWLTAAKEGMTSLQPFRPADASSAARSCSTAAPLPLPPASSAPPSPLSAPLAEEAPNADMGPAAQIGRLDRLLTMMDDEEAEASGVEQATGAGEMEVLRKVPAEAAEATAGGLCWSCPRPATVATIGANTPDPHQQPHQQAHQPAHQQPLADVLAEELSPPPPPERDAAEATAARRAAPILASAPAPTAPTAPWCVAHAVSCALLPSRGSEPEHLNGGDHQAWGERARSAPRLSSRLSERTRRSRRLSASTSAAEVGSKVGPSPYAQGVRGTRPKGAVSLRRSPPRLPPAPHEQGAQPPRQQRGDAGTAAARPPASQLASRAASAPVLAAAAPAVLPVASAHALQIGQTFGSMDELMQVILCPTGVIRYGGGQATPSRKEPSLRPPRHHRTAPELLPSKVSSGVQHFLTRLTSQPSPLN